MGVCEVVIEGKGLGILFNNSKKMFAPKTLKKKEFEPEIEAKEGCYWNEDESELMFPSYNIYSGLVRSTSGLKVPTQKKLALGPIVAGDVSVHPDFIGFGTKKYDIFCARVKVAGTYIIRARPWLKKWKLKYQVEWEEQTFGKNFDKEILPDLLAILGERIGLGDFRPEKKGPFGKFKVLSIKRISK